LGSGSFPYPVRTYIEFLNEVIRKIFGKKFWIISGSGSATWLRLDDSVLDPWLKRSLLFGLSDQDLGPKHSFTGTHDKVSFLRQKICSLFFFFYRDFFRKFVEYKYENANCTNRDDKSMLTSTQYLPVPYPSNVRNSTVRYRTGTYRTNYVTVPVLQKQH